MAVTAAALAIDHAARELVGDVRLAMKRADLSLDFVSRVTGVPPQRLSDQLNGKTPFTAFWRFTAREIRESGFWLELVALRAARVDRYVVNREIGHLIERVEELVGQKPMARMTPASLPDTRTVTLPYGAEHVDATTATSPVGGPGAGDARQRVSARHGHGGALTVRIADAG